MREIIKLNYCLHLWMFNLFRRVNVLLHIGHLIEPNCIDMALDVLDLDGLRLHRHSWWALTVVAWESTITVRNNEPSKEFFKFLLRLDLEIFWIVEFSFLLRRCHCEFFKYDVYDRWRLSSCQWNWWWFCWRKWLARANLREVIHIDRCLWWYKWRG